MTLKLYNTLTRRKEVFEPLDPSNVRMYVCGPTVYDHAHIGNARPIIVFDVLYRLLRYLAARGEWGEGVSAKYVRNITDVDDKINARAAEKGVPIRELTERTTKQFHDDIRALGVLMPEDVNEPGKPEVFVEPRATDHIPEMIAMIEGLIAKGCAYEAQGHVLFEVARMADYGKLSGRSLDEMIAGARVEVAPYKNDPMDFVLWKPSTPELPGWDSPWGRGRPGWHIECSAMANKHLGTPFDIHGGGIDLVFPHHENEIAQSRCCLGADKMASIWMHNGYLQVEGEKMSKSLGNFVTIHELLQEWAGEVLRFNMLKTHYRQRTNWTVSGLREAKDELWSWAVALVQSEAEAAAYVRDAQAQSPRPSEQLVNALSDDLNMPAAYRVLRENYALTKKDNEAAKASLLNDCEFLGILRHNKLWVHVTGAIASGAKALSAAHYDEVQKLKVYVANNLKIRQDEIISQLRAEGVEANVADDGHVELKPLDDSHVDLTKKVDALLVARNAARKAKDFAEADRIRDELVKMGIDLKDGPDGTTWEVAR